MVRLLRALAQHLRHPSRNPTIAGYSARSAAVHDITNRKPMTVTPPGALNSLWANDVFTLAKMKECLPKDVFKSVQKTIEAGAELNVSVADVVALAMKDWALSKGALCIPTVFVSWTGEALDKKTPLLRANAAMNKAAKRVLSLLGHSDIAPVNSSCGAEQEYFLVDANFVNSRSDLLLAGRTLFGASAAKGQQFDDHYFGAIPQRVQVYMQDVEQQLYRLAIPAKTRHNEVAPGQFETAPLFESANVATDHQQLLMTVLKNTAKKHRLVCLLHEKPFKGINGSGKHVNWSVGNATQGKLLDPGHTPHSNLQFLLFCGAAIRGVRKFGPLLRAVIATASHHVGVPGFADRERV